MKIQRRLDKPPPTFKRFSFHCHFTNSSTKSIMPSKPKTSRREYSDEMVGIILALREAGKSYAKIANQVKVPWPSVVQIIHRATRIQNEPYWPTKRVGRLPKLDTRVWQALICHMKRILYDNLAALGTPSKSGTMLNRKTIQAYLKAEGYLQFKARRKPHLTKKHKEARRRLEHKHMG